MKYFPLGVAGHVDHGKTSLVKALTSIDTDRLPEEKARGMSIDIGFAFLDFPQKGLKVELIDIPGHERFIKNAICGLAPVWGLLLVVDSSEGVMPQTVEHLKAAKAFGIGEVLVALTKSDKADRETLELVRLEVLELLEKEGLELFDVCSVSSLTGEGLELLKEKISAYGEKHLKEKEEWLFRFYVDSAFTVKGYGTVVRGSCVSGKVAEGDILSLEPLGIKCRVRKMQNHGVFVKEGKAGERLAINIPELSPDSIKRGYFLVKDIESSDRLIVRLKVVPKGTAYAFFGMREVRFSCRHLQEDIYLIKLSEHVPSVRGDKGPVLNSSSKLVGDYCVLHPLPFKSSKKFIRENLGLLLENPAEYLLLEKDLKGLKPEELFSFFGRQVELPKAFRLGDRLYHPASLERLTQKIREVLNEKSGIFCISELASRLKVSEELISSAVEKQKDIRVIEGYIVDARISDLTELEGYRELLGFLSQGIKEEKDLKAYEEYLKIAVRKGQVYSLGDHLYVSKELFEEYINKLKALGKEFTIRQAKELLALSRKYLLPLLEHMDRLGITKREADRRVFLK